jgi:hypothetical protein
VIKKNRSIPVEKMLIKTLDKIIKICYNSGIINIKYMSEGLIGILEVLGIVAFWFLLAWLFGDKIE